MSDVYWVNPKYQQNDLVAYFSTFEHAWVRRGDFITGSSHSQLYRWQHLCGNFYIKYYVSAGKKLRRFIGRARSKAEWENLQFFQACGIPTPEIVAFGERRWFGLFLEGILITKEIPNCCDLAMLANEQPEKFRNRAWVVSVMQQIAAYTRVLHACGFVHNDLKWRNILVDENDSNPSVYFIDCPVGRKRYGLLRKRGVIKDLACLDKVAKNVLTRTQRLGFYLRYKQQQHLSKADKNNIKKIIQFFAGRE